MLWRRSRFTYDVTDYTTELPVRAWNYRTPTVGGSRKSATGVPASYVMRREDILVVTLRFHEWDWLTVRALVVWGQAAEPFDWFPDADEATSYEVYLESPAAGTDIVPTRLSDFPRVLELTIEIRKVDGTPWDVEYWPDEDAS